MAEGGDYYVVLGLRPDASEKDVKRAFRAAAKECHPDVAGNDPVKTEKFKKLREAYETLSDPAKRAAYDRRNERRSSNSPFYGSHWKQAGTPTGGSGVGNKATASAGNNIDLEDIFNDFGGVDFGFGKKAAPKPPPAPRGGRARPDFQQWDPIRDFKQAAERDTWPGAGESGNDFGRGAGGGWSGDPGRPQAPPPRPAYSGPAEPGADVHVNVNVPGSILGLGGLVTVEYDRDVRADDGVSVLSVKELYELRVPPGVRDQEELRVEKMGHAGRGGGAYGALVARVHITGPGPRMKMPKGEAERPTPGDVVAVEVPFTEAILGGRVEVDTPQGRVRISIPAGSSTGARFRLKGRGPAGADGTPTDLYAEVRVTVPRTLDEESRRLIERFAELNPPER